ncbi:hypothetical protein [Actinoplanes sp. TFC3]|uniref:hypothetical protein n=1 Tax=Actinoplanes sp. TFC3 TaxID=1710355 RepID=UPI000A7D6669|nr:hypothetical protein [Actinoplanes sp. TFC3]
MKYTPRRKTLFVAAVALAALTACGSEADQPTKSDAQVATLTSAGPPPAPSKAAKERPRERLDTTSEEFLALLEPYNKCIVENGGASKEQAAKGAGAARPASKKEQAKFDAANRICEPQYYPLPPWEKDPANPEAKDFARDVVRCLKDKGVEYVEVAEDGLSYAFGGDNNDAKSISKGLDLAPDCEREVAAKK